jgi:hypothetical protein
MQGDRMSRTDYEDRCVEEIDGVKRAYMEISDGETVMRFHYRTLAYIGRDREQVQAAMNVVIEGIILALKAKGDGLIIWRLRPEIEEQLDPETGEYTVLCRARLDTAPKLDEKTWDEVCVVREGQPYTDLRKPDLGAKFKPPAVLENYEVTG